MKLFLCQWDATKIAKPGMLQLHCMNCNHHWVLHISLFTVVLNDIFCTYLGDSLHTRLPYTELHSDNYQRLRICHVDALIFSDECWLNDIMWNGVLMLVKICPECIKANMFPDTILERWGRCCRGHLDSWKEPPVLNEEGSSYFCVGGWDISLNQSVCM